MSLLPMSRASKGGLTAAAPRHTTTHIIASSRSFELRRVACAAHRAGRPDQAAGDDEDERQYEVITLVTADGLVQLPGRVLRPRARKAQAQRRPRGADGPLGQALPLPSWEQQGLCIGNVFRIAATNGCDLGRRINVLGFCRSVDLVGEAVEDAVRRSGGEVVVMESKQLGGGLHETLQMTVALPHLFGVPPLYARLSSAIVEGGGFVDRVTNEWHIFGGERA